jgi:hypothetical protein
MRCCEKAAGAIPGGGCNDDAATARGAVESCCRRVGPEDPGNANSEADDDAAFHRRGSPSILRIALVVAAVVAFAVVNLAAVLVVVVVVVVVGPELHRPPPRRAAAAAAAAADRIINATDRGCLVIYCHRMLESRRTCVSRLCQLWFPSTRSPIGAIVKCRRQLPLRFPWPRRTDRLPNRKEPCADVIHDVDSH